MKNLASLTALLLAAAASACSAGSDDPATPGITDTLRVPLGRAERARIAATTELAGVVEAKRSTAVSSRVVALVTSVHVALGDTVDAGELLVSIDPTAASGELAQAEGALTQARAALALAERNYERFLALRESEAASELELDLARAQFEQAGGAVAQAAGAVEAARSVASESRVVAPYAGRVASRQVEIGELAAPGRPLMTIESARGRRLAVAVPERLALAAGLEPGVRVDLSIDASPHLGRFEGQVIEVSPGPDPTTHAYTVRIDLGELAVASGAAGRARIPSGQRDAVIVPAAAIVRSGGLELVVVRDAEGRSRSRVVQLGEAQPDGTVELLSGLAGGEEVALGLAAAPRAGTVLERLEP